MNPRWLAGCALAAALAVSAPALAVLPDEVLADPALETRARTLSAELRCMVCQNQSIDDSEADLARDLRLLVRERLKAGDSNDRILTFLVARYGEFVLLKPRFDLKNGLLWATPVLLLALAGAGLLFRARQGHGPAAPVLSAEDEAELERLTGPS